MSTQNIRLESAAHHTLIGLSSVSIAAVTAGKCLIWRAIAGAWVTGGIADGGAVRGVSDGAAAIGVGGGVGSVAVACGVGALAAEACGAGGGAVAFAASASFCGRPVVFSGKSSSRTRLLLTMATAWSVA